ncbi:TrmH family RNA methyltransferase [Marinifilum sp. D737]|uniref:TrmH family RNA methyltransferase n=1 Tax=Marinifilum sp. D737 TaxID=2969628 RepID=UPI0022766CE6|nr:RNA methyltransferase [Marinifilum sp. D737]MCY1633374.1 RNA methyltransferase [Marinifilum sp. D737]
MSIAFILEKRQHKQSDLLTLKLLAVLSKNQIKLISSLQKKKYRDSHQLFVAEGDKLVMDLLQTNIKVAYLVHTPDWKNAPTTEHLNQIENRIETDLKLMKKVSSLKTPSPVLAVFRIPASDIDEHTIKNSLSILLDDVQDPGNLGTIIRIADWFGIKNIFCSQNTVDVYNPKVIQASMGAIARVKVSYSSLSDLISHYHTEDFPVYGTFLEGETIYKCELQNKGFIVMGNEGQGISEEIGQMVSDKLFIPNFPADQETSESLNVSVATSIICSEFRRGEY